ncbi:MAG: hypothetical protein ACRD4P_04680 [Bryobacteraceae bacterium]
MLQVLRQVAALIAEELRLRHREAVRLQPGRLFCPKLVHELESLEADAPDGLSPAYLELAVARNAAAWQDINSDSTVTILARQISQQLGRAALLERQLLEQLIDK